jgi:glycosyltransferase involved in cell wall biosynthesis
VKVLHVLNGLGTGGAERSLAELLPRLAADGIDGAVACLHRRAEGVQESVIAAGVDVRFVGGRGLPGRVLALRRLLRDLRPDVVHTTIIDSDIAARLAAWRTGIPVVSSLVNVSYGEERRRDPAIRPWRLTAVRLLDGWTARHLTTGFIAISDAVADASVRDLGIDRGRVCVVPRGREPARFASVAPAELDVPPDAEVLLHVGRQEYQKGLDVLVEALGVVRAARPDVVLVQAGRDGAATASLRAAISAGGLDDAVRLVGHRDDVPALLAAATVFVFPSRFEGLGGSLIEALAAGVPIVASDLPAVREVVEHGRTGDLVPPGDARALANAVLDLLGAPDRRRAYAAAGRADFEVRYALDGVAAQFAAALRGLSAVRS